ncbi:hypothetical protein ACRQ5Q_14780 [Bradyrhizobium sp. PMVTL-01]|uniref:hypothetical protein n=1 Tax=Bradyrhizobium sp. PMVTL-01 TaxID=3434999 RepID=UPI003F7062E0
MADVTYKIPAQHPKSKKMMEQERTGRVAYFTIGERRVKFVLQFPNVHPSQPDARKPEALVHFASGMVFGRINEAKVRCMAARGIHGVPNDRDAAEMLVAEAVARMGADEVLKRLDAAPALNT